LNFKTHFPGAQTLYLGTNYRSTKSIVEACRKTAPVQNELIARFNTPNAQGESPIIRGYASTFDEAGNIVGKANPYKSTTAILSRTNAYLALFEDMCYDLGQNYYNLGNSGFWCQPEIKGALQRFKRYAPTVPIEKVIEDLGRLRQQYLEEESTSDNDSSSNIGALAKIAVRFRTVKEFLDYARRASHSSKKRDGAIALGTVHAAKGLEFDNVFVVGIHDGQFPHKQASNYEEERRIFFVAVSRAAQRLHLSYVGAPSPFLQVLNEPTA
jgi:DNA helicase-2/ATP-dependent DNA helicase PcrA